MYDFTSFSQGSDKLIQHLKRELSVLRTSGASPQLLDTVQVNAYDSKMRITELATISVVDPTMLVVTPWDSSIITAIEQAINQANLNLHPVVDGQTIRISVPPLTGETREKLAKTLSGKIEEAKVMLRNLRAEYKKDIEKQKGYSDISEDNIKADLANLENKVKAVSEQIDALEKQKRIELLKI